MEQRIQEFLDFLVTEKKFSANTLAAYRNDLSQFHSFLAGLPNAPTAWGDVSQTMVTLFVTELKERNYALATIARKIAAVKSFFQFLSSAGIVPSNVTEALESPKVGKTLPRAISEEQVQRLLDQPARLASPEGRRDRAMLELLYATGLRVSELVSLNVDDYSVEDAQVSCPGKTKDRKIAVNKSAQSALLEYLDDGRPPLVRHRNGEQALFVNHRGERLTRQGVWLIIKLHARRAGIDVAITPHTLRHSFAAHALQSSNDVRSIQEILGHTSKASTQIYAQLTHARPAREGVAAQ
ncbi:MAG TPA: tyrosine recombinase [Dehalococcoidia bacterium]|nr:tyrosine recombinase [Dehalococcoidia bacterium]